MVGYGDNPIHYFHDTLLLLYGYKRASPVFLAIKCRGGVSKPLLSGGSVFNFICSIKVIMLLKQKNYIPKWLCIILNCPRTRQKILGNRLGEKIGTDYFFSTSISELARILAIFLQINVHKNSALNTKIRFIWHKNQILITICQFHLKK